MVLQRVRLMHKKGKFLVQVFQPQQRANTLVERVFVDNQSDVPFKVEAGKYSVILNYAALNDKSRLRFFAVSIPRRGWLRLGRQFRVQGVQALHLRRQRGHIAIVDNYVVGCCQPGLTRRLCRHDGAHLLLRHAVA